MTRVRILSHAGEALAEEADWTPNRWIYPVKAGVATHVQVDDNDPVPLIAPQTLTAGMSAELDMPHDCLGDRDDWVDWGCW